MAKLFLEQHDPIYFSIGEEEGRAKMRVSKTLEWIYQITWDSFMFNDHLKLGYRFLVDAAVSLEVQTVLRSDPFYEPTPTGFGLS
jgi:hypothetical protein